MLKEKLTTKPFPISTHSIAVVIPKPIVYALGIDIDNSKIEFVLDYENKSAIIRKMESEKE